MLLGADGVQIGSRFAATKEASSHENFKQKLLKRRKGNSFNSKRISSVRLIKNKFYNDIEKLYESGRDTEALKAVLGRARAKRGMFEGDLEEGELEIGQSSALIDSILSVEEVFEKLIKEFREAECPEL